MLKKTLRNLACAQGRGIQFNHLSYKISFKKENGHADFEIRQSPTCIICCVNATDLTKKIAVPTPRLPSYTKKWLYFSGQSVPRLFK